MLRKTCENEHVDQPCTAQCRISQINSGASEEPDGKAIVEKVSKSEHEFYLILNSLFGCDDVTFLPPPPFLLHVLHVCYPSWWWIQDGSSSSHRQKGKSQEVCVCVCVCACLLVAVSWFCVLFKLPLDLRNGVFWA